MTQDKDNITFLSDVEKVYSDQGQQFHREKYLPKLTRVEKYLLTNAEQSLDVGIGYGSFMSMCEAELGLKAHGLDPFPRSIEIAQQYTQGVILEGCIEDPSWGFDQKFDLISCLDVTEHLEEPALFYRHVKRYLAPGGIVLMTTPLREFPYEMRSWPLIGIPDNNTTHINVQPPRYWDKLAYEHGFDILESWRGEHMTHVRYLSGALRRFCNVLGIDPKNTPIVSSFQQAYNQILRVA